MLILGTATHTNWLTSQLLEWKPVRWIGRISYSLYLWQQLFLMPSWESHPLKLAQELPWNLLFPLLCAVVSHYCIERPAIRFGRRVAMRLSRGEQIREALPATLGAVVA